MLTIYSNAYSRTKLSFIKTKASFAGMKPLSCAYKAINNDFL